MSKNTIIAVLIIISLSSTIYAIYQQKEAKRLESMAVANAEMARQAMAEADAQRIEAEKQSMIAMEAMTKIEMQLKLALEKCK